MARLQQRRRFAAGPCDEDAEKLQMIGHLIKYIDEKSPK